MKKTYISLYSATSILVKVHDKVKRLEFEPDIITSIGHRGSSYSTEDKDIQYAVEHHPQFRNGRRDSITIYGQPFEKEQEVELTELPNLRDASETLPRGKKVTRKGKVKKEE